MKLAIALMAFLSAYAVAESYADDFVFPGGVTVATMAGIAAATRSTAFGPPPPPAPYSFGYSGYAGRGPGRTSCWIEPEQEWNGYSFVAARVRFCR